MRPSLLAIALLTLAACERAAEAPPPKPAAASHTPAAAEPPFYVGRWAAEPALCRTGAWVVTAQGVQTAGEVTCRFDGAPKGTGPVEVDATCRAEGEEGRWRLKISYAESARALLIENGPFAPIGLTRCSDAAYPLVEPAEPGQPGGLPDDRTPLAEGPFAPESAQGAASVLERYFASLEARDYGAARRLWADSGMSQAAFERSFAAYDSYSAQIGAPGSVEGAAGSAYVEVPVQIYGRRKDGREFRVLGKATLRRAAEVPGATAGRRAWRIYRLEPERP